MFLLNHLTAILIQQIKSSFDKIYPQSFSLSWIKIQSSRTQCEGIYSLTVRWWGTSKKKVAEPIWGRNTCKSLNQRDVSEKRNWAVIRDRILRLLQVFQEILLPCSIFESSSFRFQIYQPLDLPSDKPCLAKLKLFTIKYISLYK